jgi:predicted nucleotidyltransferase
MQCLECGGSYVESSERYVYKDFIVGDIAVQGKKFYRCNKCGDVLFTLEMSCALDEAIHERKQQLIGSLPIRDFITATKTAKLLGVTRQALNKNRRIKKGFIHQTTLGDNTVYVKRSVMRYKRTGDGRYPLSGLISGIPGAVVEQCGTMMDKDSVLETVSLPMEERLGEDLIVRRFHVPENRLAEFCRRHHIRKLSLFGSVLRDDFKPDSDIDVLVEFEPGHVPGFAIIDMEKELSQLAGRKVDLRTAGDLSRYFRERVVSEARLEYSIDR